MRILTLTTLYPNAAAPTHGVFVGNRLAAFAARHDADIKVVAPIPWFPVNAGWAGIYAAYARAPHAETRRGLKVFHPRYAIPPKIGMTYAATALERCFVKAARALIDSGWDFDLIDAHYLYPDGVAAVRAARRLGKPVIVTARGSDVSTLPAFPRQRQMILEAVYRADGVIAVAGALKSELVRLGTPKEKIRTLRNGVDLDLFKPLDREKIRTALALKGPVIASVGHLIERKGHDLVIEALTSISETTLLVAGAGEERTNLERLAVRLGITDRVRFLGTVPHEKLAEIYCAADALVLASSREGWPNVLLEAMACGTPVVATPVWGSTEVVRTPEAGALSRERTVSSIAAALSSLLADPPARQETRRYAEKFSWEETSDGLAALFEEAIETHRRTRAVTTRPINLPKAPPRLIVTVDAEEIFNWSDFDHPAHRAAPPKDIDRFQQLAAAYGAKPLYFLTWPLIEDEETACHFRALLKSGAADLGLHFHQWATPPAEGYAGEYYSWQSNLPEQIYEKKLRALADRFEKTFGFRARAHRAGRYGVSKRDYAALAATGIALDFSPSAGFDFSKKGGPDFSTMRNEPFFMETKNGERIAVTPVCGGRALRGGRFFLPTPAGKAGFRTDRRRARRGLTASMRLTCEGKAFDDLKALTKRLVADETPVLTFSLHSTSMTPGASPYARDAAAIDAMLETARRYFEFFTREVGGAFIDLEGLAGLYDLAERDAAAPSILNRALTAGA